MTATRVGWDAELDERLAMLTESPRTYWTTRSSMKWQ